MPLIILVPLVVGGILVIALLTYGLGLSRPLTFASEDQARAAWQREFDTIKVDSVILSQSGQAALILTQQGPGLVWAIGADSTARLLDQAQLHPSPTGLILSLPDFSAPRIPVSLTRQEAEHWTHLIGATT